jgi:HEAT repeat protein
VRAVEPLICAIGDSDGSVRLAAVEALARLGHLKWAHWVKGDDKDPDRLGASKDSESIEPLVRALGEGGWRFRCAAARALAQLGDARAVEPLIRTLGNSDRVVGRTAAEALGQLGDVRAVEHLLHALGDSDGNVRCAAAGALGQLGDARAVEPLLVLALGDRDTDLRRASADALGQLGTARAAEPLVRALVRALQSERLAERETAARMLVGIAKNNPEALRSNWRWVARLVRQPHTSEHSDRGRTMDCHGDVHYDHGIGLDFPDPPAMFGNVKPDF